jgi:NAD(P)-dependent dehydrogenase (short-subunit alcohol dehydrogenase family)
MTGTQQRTALVTGASTGIGLEIAKAMALAGYDLAVTARDAKGALAEAIKDKAFVGHKIVPISLDQREEASIVKGFAAAVAGLGTIDVLVNNAARALIKPIVETTWAEWNDVMDTNLRGVFFVSQQFARHCMEKGRPGAIVGISSTHGRAAIAGRSVYGIGKGGLEQMTRMMAIEWASAGIRVNAVAPTTVMTPSREAALSDPQRRQQMLARIPLRKFPDASEVAGAVLYLAGPSAASITGHILMVDGGLTAE